MTWERFGYICRKASAVVSSPNNITSDNLNSNANKSIAEYLTSIENEKASDLYGKKFTVNSWPQKIVQAIANMPDANKAQWALSIYKDLDLTKRFQEPIQFKRTIAYLSLIVAVFYIMISVYTIKITSVVLELFANFEGSTPTRLLNYQYYAGTFVIVAAALLFYALLIGFQLKKLFRFQANIENSLIIKYLIFPNIRKSYMRVIDILTYPLLSTQLQDHSAKNSSLNNSRHNLIIAHLQNVEASNMSVAKEMQELIDIQMQGLLISCERQLKLITVLITLIVVSAIFFFLVSAYAPMFMFGGVF